jgi:hypothetical protein
MTNNTDSAFKPLTTQEQSVTKTVKPEKDEGVHVAPVPENTNLEIPRHPLGNPSQMWTYHNENKRPMFHICRWDKPEGGKDIRPLTYRQYPSGSCRWFFKAADLPWVPYNLPGMLDRTDAKILVCEGEKSADAAQRLFPDYVTTASAGGAMAGDKTDWKALAGRHVLIWPDNDPAGEKFALTVAELALAAGAVSVAIVQVPKEWSEGWDLAEAFPEGITIDALRAMMENAKPFMPPPDPLDGLVERSESDPGEAFKPEVIEALKNLKRKDAAAFESLRFKLRGVDVRVSKLDEVIEESEMNGADGDDEDDGGLDPSQTDRLLQLAASANFFHTKDGIGYAEVEVHGHTEIWPIKNKGFRMWLLQQYFELQGRAPNSESFNAALNTIEAQSFFNAPEQEVFLRATQHEGKIYIDLCNQKWQVIEVDVNGWRVIDKSPVRFRRAAGMAPLPIPTRTGSINDLQEFLNVRDEDDFVLAVSFMLDSLRGKGPNPVLAVSGEQGSAKTTFVKCIKGTVDPNTTPLRTLPREERDLFIAANNGYVLAFDNVSGISGWLSDAFCRLSTGGGFATRQLHTDQDEILFQAMRPLILNGIDDIITKPDLADRAVLITLEAIPEDKRKTENEVMSAFERKLPGILGALLDGVVHGLKTLPDTRLESLPRMADFSLWASACEGAFWEPGTFMAAYTQNRADAVEDVLEADPVASAVIQLVDMGEPWQGTASQLLQECNKIVGPDAQKNKYWPANARMMSNRLTRAATFLRKKGFDVLRWRDTKAERTRIIKITWVGVDKAGNLPSEPSAATEPPASGPGVVPTGAPQEPAAAARPVSTLSVEEVGFDMRAFSDETDAPDAKNPLAFGLDPL